MFTTRISAAAAHPMLVLHRYRVAMAVIYAIMTVYELGCLADLLAGRIGCPKALLGLFGFSFLFGTMWGVAHWLVARALLAGGMRITVAMSIGVIATPVLMYILCIHIFGCHGMWPEPMSQCPG